MLPWPWGRALSQGLIGKTALGSETSRVLRRDITDSIAAARCLSDRKCEAIPPTAMVLRQVLQNSPSRKPQGREKDKKAPKVIGLQEGLENLSAVDVGGRPLRPHSGS